MEVKVGQFIYSILLRIEATIWVEDDRNFRIPARRAEADDASDTDEGISKKKQSHHRLKDGFPTRQNVSGKVVDQRLSHFNSNEACIVSLLRVSDEKLNFITNWESSYSIPWTPFGVKIQSISDMEEYSGEM